MNDDFLNQFQRSPRPEFESALYKKINKPIYTPNKNLSLRRLGYFFGIAITLLALTVISVPNARAAVQSVIRKIAGIYFDEVTESPITCDPMKCLPMDASETMSLEEVKASATFTFNLPAWTPEGYWLNPRARIFKSDSGGDSVEIEWLKTGFTQINHWDYVQQMTLSIWQDRGDFPIQAVGTGSVSEIEVNGQPAALIHGAWELFRKDWDGNGSTRIIWVRNGVRYMLFAAFVEPATAISDEDMIRIAESIR